MRKYHCVDYKLFGKQVRNFRLKLKLTQRELSEMMDCNETYISKIETGKAIPTLEFTCLLAQCLNVGIDTLVQNTPKGQKIAEDEYQHNKQQFSSQLLDFLKIIEDAAQSFEKHIKEKHKKDV